MTPQEIKTTVNKMGFKLSKIESIPNPVNIGKVYRGLIHCVCGRHESFGVIESAQFCSLFTEEEHCYAALWDFGSFSDKHLRVDGFTEEQICSIKNGEYNKLDEWCGICEGE